MGTIDLAPGLLLAAPSLHDRNFNKTVVLLGRSGEDGALGWVINGRELMSVRELLESSELLGPEVAVPAGGAFARAACVGGPVAPASGWLIYHRGANPLPGEIALGPDLGVTGEMAAFTAVMQGDGPTDFRVVLGCAGWGPGQLEAEIGAGAWLPAPVEAPLVFDAGDAVWDRAYHMSVGAAPAAFTSKRGKA